MKTGYKIVLGIMAVTALVIVGLGAGWLLWGRWLWAPGMMGGRGMTWGASGCSGGFGTTWRGPMPRGMGSGMMHDGRVWGRTDFCDTAGGYPSVTAGTISIEEAQEAVEAYIGSLGYDGLEIAELMEFERNFYAIVREHDTGIGAMELLVDKSTATVGPEMGPNMMWNARYGMHGRGSMMMGRTSGVNTLSEEQALKSAQRWLDANRPGITTEEHADPFYGYYTIHTIKDETIEGMLSVHGTTGQVWYHTWHGGFVRMIEDTHGHG